MLAKLMDLIALQTSSAQGILKKKDKGTKNNTEMKCLSYFNLQV